jgi:hypothetical protein
VQIGPHKVCSADAYFETRAPDYGVTIVSYHTEPNLRSLCPTRLLFAELPFLTAIESGVNLGRARAKHFLAG